MILKTYRSTSVLSFSITMPAGNYRRIRFTPFSYGGGIYVTDDVKEQQVLESLPEFGTSYRLVEVQSDEGNNDNVDANVDANDVSRKREDVRGKTEDGKVNPNDNPNDNVDNGQQSDADANPDEGIGKTEEVRVGDEAGETEAEQAEDDNAIHVADLSEAKEYLMEHFGYKSAQLRSKKSIEAAAEKNNIVFAYA